jgi:hypothetical protein
MGISCDTGGMIFITLQFIGVNRLQRYQWQSQQDQKRDYTVRF